MNERDTSVGTLTLTDHEVIEWWLSHDARPPKQDEWVQEVTGRETASVTGYTITDIPNDPTLEIEYRYINEKTTPSYEDT